MNKLAIPKIAQYFEPLLLITPMPKLGDDADKLLDIYIYIDKKLSKKLKNYPKKLDRYNVLKQKFLDIYERIKKKEIEFGKAKEKPFKMPPYYIGLSNRSKSDLFGRLSQKARAFSSTKY